MFGSITGANDAQILPLIDVCAGTLIEDRPSDLTCVNKGLQTDEGLLQNDGAWCIRIGGIRRCSCVIPRGVLPSVVRRHLVTCHFGGSSDGEGQALHPLDWEREPMVSQSPPGPRKSSGATETIDGSLPPVIRVARMAIITGQEAQPSPPPVAHAHPPTKLKGWGMSPPHAVLVDVTS